MKWEGVVVPSNFDPKKRPLYVYPVSDMSRKNRDVAFPQVAEALFRILERHPSDRILCHTVSYELSHSLRSNVNNSRCVSYNSSAEKPKAISKYLRQPASVLLAPSLDRGIDLPHDDCRVIVVAKIPFPNLSDKQVAARLYGTGREGRNWYTMKTIRSLVQMSGRGMRSVDDYCETYILDKQFLQLHRQNKHLLPSWWRDALVWDRGTL
jgi:ATP-dependent DNA helicase DinG